MNFQQFLNEETRTANSAAVIKDVLDKVGMGLETVRQTQTKENTSTSTYKLNGHGVEAIWVMDDGPMKEEGYSFAIQLFRILAANKDICAALMGPNGDMAFVEKIEKLVEDAVLPELFTMFPQNVNDIKYAYAFCINGCVGMIKCWLTGDSDDTPEHMAYLTHNIVSEAPRNFAAKVFSKLFTMFS